MLKTVRALVFSLASTLALSGCSMLGSAPEQELDDLIVGVNYVGVTVADLESSEAFFTSAFQTETIGEDAIPRDAIPQELAEFEARAIRTVLLRRTNGQLRLLQFDGEAYGAPADHPVVPVEGPGIMHVCFQAKQQTDTYARALAAGAEPIGNEELVALSSRNPVEYGYITEANGFVIEVEEV